MNPGPPTAQAWDSSEHSATGENVLVEGGLVILC